MKMKALVMEHAARNVLDEQRGVRPTGRSIAILGSKVCAVESGERMLEESAGGEDSYCTIHMDGGQVFLVCGEADRVLGFLGLETD